jgi:hypothetical protein
VFIFTNSEDKSLLSPISVSNMGLASKVENNNGCTAVARLNTPPLYFSSTVTNDTVLLTTALQ